MIGKDLLCLCWHGNRLHTYIWEELLHEGIVTVVQQALEILELGVLWNGIGPVNVGPEVWHSLTKITHRSSQKEGPFLTLFLSMNPWMLYVTKPA